MADLDNNKGSGAKLLRPVIAVIAVLAIAFCGWSAWQYSQGNDPLAIFGGSALQTVEQTGDSQSATPQIVTTSTTVTADDVCAAVAGLSFDGTDVSVPSDEVVAVISDGGIWIEQATTDDAATMASATARRAAALAAWAGEQNVDFSQVTWISEDANGMVRMVVRYACDGAPTSGSDAELLAAASGYSISGNAYADLGDNPSFAQSAGTTPVLPDSNDITVVQDKTVDGETLTKTVTTYRVVDANGNEVSSKSSGGSSASGSASGSSSSGSASGSSSQQANTITVSITVDGSAAGAGSSTASLTLSSDATVYDALASCGVSFNAKSTGYGMYVSSIAGLAEKDHGSMSGWVYSVNGVTPNVSCSSYGLSNGDSIYWSYVNVEN